MKNYSFVDYTDRYHSVMQFDKNKNVFVHRWYPFVEGYSKEFINDILNEIPFIPTCALEPFCGSGTTPVELQDHGIKCYSFEVSPFMYLLSKVKLERDYDKDIFDAYVAVLKSSLSECRLDIRDLERLPFGRTVVRNTESKKWNFHDSAIDGLLDIRHAIKTVIPDVIYRNLFTVALASILLQTSNLFRNGKCLSYKKGWENRILSRTAVHDLFFEKLNTIFSDDISIISQMEPTVRNSDYCLFGDVRENIRLIADGAVDLIITSPPYLNSRDYTDIYMLELKVLELVNSYEELQNLRKSTLRSHVQVRYDSICPIDNQRLKQCLETMSAQSTDSWNIDIVNMICGYFEDMEYLFREFSRVVKSGGFIYFNVANSAYFGVEIPVDFIIADIAENCGFHVCEIRKARNLKTSPQQSQIIGKLHESVIVMQR